MQLSGKGAEYYLSPGTRYAMGKVETQARQSAEGGRGKEIC